MDDAGRGERMPALPSGAFGASPGAPPGATRPAPRQGGIHGVGVPPEILRQRPGAQRATLAGAEAAQRIRMALRKAQRKLLRSRRKLEREIAAVRANLESRL